MKEGIYTMKNVSTAILVALLLWLSQGSHAETPPDGAPADWPEPIEDDRIVSFLLIDHLEYQDKDGDDAFAWEAEGWIGTDYNKIWIKMEGEKPVDDEVEAAEVQLLYSRLIAPFWDLQAGFRYDPEPDPSRSFAVLGVQGMAPYWFEVQAAAFISDDGDVSARFEAEYDILLTQRLIAQPLFEVNLAAQDVEELDIGSGFTDLELGLRLRYEIRREFAPYIGVSYERKLGETADLAEAEGEDKDSFAIVAGVRFWF